MGVAVDVSSIKEYAQELRQMYFNKDTSVQESLKNIANDNDVEILYDTWSEPTKYDSIKKKYIITLSYRLDLEYNNYRLATELGRCLFRLVWKNVDDKICAIFASELLIPERILKDISADYEYNEKLIAKFFDVPYPVVGIKMYFLNLKEYN